MIFKNYYKLLDLPNNTKSTQNEIKIAYRFQAKKYHPDVNIQNRAAEERFKDINEAYRILSDPIQKKKYDRSWNSYVGRRLQKERQSQKEVRANDIVSMFFGKDVSIKSQPKASPIKGENIETTIPVSVKEAFDGTKKKLVLNSKKGEKESISVDIPSGIKNGDKIRVKGKGKKGKNGGNNGDLVLNISIENDAMYQLENDDICVKLYVAPWDAALGSKVSVDGIDGQVSVLIPKGTQNGDKISIPNKGYRKANNERGNLVIKTEIVIPKKLSDDEKKLFKELKSRSKFDPKNIVDIR